MQIIMMFFSLNKTIKTMYDSTEFPNSVSNLNL